MDTLKNWNTATNTTTSLTGSDGFCTSNCSRPRSETGIFQSSKQLQFCSGSSTVSVFIGINPTLLTQTKYRQPMKQNLLLLQKHSTNKK
jgi:hypothetical protein